VKDRVLHAERKQRHGSAARCPDGYVARYLFDPLAYAAQHLAPTRPILLLVTDQPEQRSNAARAAELGLVHEVVCWSGDARLFASQTADALRLTAAAQDGADAGLQRAQQRLDAWGDCLLGLAAEARQVSPGWHP
jgi:hypothetical protein